MWMRCGKPKIVGMRDVNVFSYTNKYANHWCGWLRHVMEGRIMGGYKKKKVLALADRYATPSDKYEWQVYWKDLGALLK